LPAPFLLLPATWAIFGHLVPLLPSPRHGCPLPEPYSHAPSRQPPPSCGAALPLGPCPCRPPPRHG
jgi:hypothetical protein